MRIRNIRAVSVLFSISISFFFFVEHLSFFCLAHSQNFTRFRANTISVYRVANVLPARNGKCYFTRFQYPKPNIIAFLNTISNRLDSRHRVPEYGLQFDHQSVPSTFFCDESFPPAIQTFALWFFPCSQCFSKLIG